MRKHEMAYKYNICGKMGFGYGSKYQLLRMLGWHRNMFNCAIAKTAQVQEQIIWEDFLFHGPEDKELMNASFLDKVISNEWNAYWPTNGGKNGLNWDAVGFVDGTYILVEAKAHTGECGDKKTKGGGKHNADAVQAFKTFQEKYNLEVIDWSDREIYQIANRLIFLDFLKEKGIKAKLVYVLFINGYEFNTTNGISKSVTSQEQWENKFVELFHRMGINDKPVEEMITFCYIDCNPVN